MNDDLIERAEKWLVQCPNCDCGMSMSCICPPGDPRNIIAALVDEVNRFRAFYDSIAELVSEH